MNKEAFLEEEDVKGYWEHTVPCVSWEQEVVQFCSGVPCGRYGVGEGRRGTGMAGGNPRQLSQGFIKGLITSAHIGPVSVY